MAKEAQNASKQQDVLDLDLEFRSNNHNVNNELQLPKVNEKESANYDDPRSGTHQTEVRNETEMTKEQISVALSGVLEAIKAKRTNDRTLLAEMGKRISSQAEKSRVMLEKHLTSLHERKGREVDLVVDKINGFLERTSTVESELEHLKDSLHFLCRDLCNK
ncbi:synaptonemal complex central element protein 2 [Biomphalaria glabrata]|nr:synaptonemal complex central element protein 2-like isoform X2 [Biomphalaria glabrata]